MSDVALALDGASFEGLVKIEELAGQGMVTLRGNLTDKAIVKAVKDVFGVSLPGTRETAFEGDTGALWMSPDEALLLCAYDAAQAKADDLAAKLAGSHALVVNVSDARAVFQLKGSMLREVIAKLAPVDMSPDVFKPGAVRRTRMAQVAAAFWMDDASTARVVCFRSVAEYMFNLLSTAADDSSAVNHFTR
ncbi:sarcosine oxidase subunit gamma family protein [Marivita sp. XM-24bin2]|jgi:sarcosine oxidase subunit gamma|uniref:sarcosine oxidase subunit gamma n=1 Tax=unclassified Marivita TaxID=2632480 RepID=UPI000D7A13B7|nr:sarcosine oxidase subunit gamma family protein [Marivita sp. XM-24bin2]MCR9107420.1 sarcosine oxidase subunit gamma [Paracoccaceae bacterium]PWL35767.1 MAG: sarcosine oxidase subunit gamma [Marivita sp. XM-24bin2]